MLQTALKEWFGNMRVYKLTVWKCWTKNQTVTWKTFSGIQVTCWISPLPV